MWKRGADLIVGEGTIPHHLRTTAALAAAVDHQLSLTERIPDTRLFTKLGKKSRICRYREI